MAPEMRLSTANTNHWLIDLSVFLSFIRRTSSLNGSARPAAIKNKKPAANIVLRKQMNSEVVFFMMLSIANGQGKWLAEGQSA